MLALLPPVSDFATKLQLPISLPLATNMVQQFSCALPHGSPTAFFLLTNGYMFWYDFGHVVGFASPHSYYRLQDPRDIPLYYGKLNLTEGEAVMMARHALTSLGYDLERVFADQPPEIAPLPERDGHVVPVFRIIWHNPLETAWFNTAIDIEIDGQRKCIQNIRMTTRCFNGVPPKIEGPTELVQGSEALDKSRSNYFAGMILAKLPAYVAALRLPVNSVASAEEIENLVVLSESKFSIKLKNQYRFWYERGEIAGFAAPDAVSSRQPRAAS